MIKTLRSNFMNIAILAVLAVLVYQGQHPVMQAPRKQQPDIPVGVSVAPVLATDLKGDPAKINWSDPHDKRPVLAYIFQPGCHWCVSNEANFEALYSAKKDEYRFIGLSPRAEGTAELPESKLGFPIYTGYGSDKTGSLFRVGTPTTVLIANGKITNVWKGAWNEPVAKTIESLMSVKLPGLTPEPSRASPTHAAAPALFLP